MTTSEDISPEDRALGWLALRLDGSMAAADRRIFEVWRTSSPENAAAYAEAEVLWARLDWSNILNQTSLSKVSEPQLPSMPHSGRGQRTDSRPESRPSSRPGLSRRGFAAMAAGLGAVALTPLALNLSRGDTRRFATDVGEIQHLSLDDGSRVSLGGRSALSARIDDRLRAIQLNEGEAYFDVARDEARVFTVTGPGVSVEALGTAFEVRLGKDRSEVFVEEGQVRVTATTSGDHLTLVAGERAMIRAGKVRQTVIDTATVAPWRYQRFSFIDRPLAEVVAEVNRYYQPGVTLASRELGERKVTAAFTIGQIPQVLESLAHELGGRLARPSDGSEALAILPKN